MYACVHTDHTGWPNELSTLLPFSVEHGVRTHGFQSWPSQTNDLKMYVCRFLDWALLGYGKDWLAQCQDDVTEWGI